MHTFTHTFTHSKRHHVPSDIISKLTAIDGGKMSSLGFLRVDGDSWSVPYECRDLLLYLYQQLEQEESRMHGVWVYGSFQEDQISSEASLTSAGVKVIKNYFFTDYYHNTQFFFFVYVWGNESEKSPVEYFAVKEGKVYSLKGSFPLSQQRESFTFKPRGSFVFSLLIISNMHGQNFLIL